MSYVKHVSRRQTPQTEALRGQVKNSAGGYSYPVDNFTRLERFLVLGCEGGSYYATERALTKENAKCVYDCIAEDPARTVMTICAVSQEGRAPKNDPAIFALAIAASSRNPVAEKAALDGLNTVCRIGTHLFQFVEAVNELRGWGRALKRAVANWYLSRSPLSLAEQVTKYQQRNGWSHRDVLRLCHAHTTRTSLNDVLKYVTQREAWTNDGYSGGVIDAREFLTAVEIAKIASESQIISLIKEAGLLREHIPTEHLNSPKVWEALVEDMPITATIRNLGKMTSIGLLKPLAAATRTVYQRLTDPDLLKKGRVHPFNILVALKTYQQGAGFRGSLSWKPVPKIIEGLEDAFYTAFDAVEPTGKNFLFGIDVSGSMGSPINNTNVSCRSAAACLAMVSYRTEPNSYAFGFTNRFEDLGINAKMSLGDVEKRVCRHDFGSTDCAVPTTYALQNRLEVDAFVVLTDNETYAGRIHPTVALEEYRQKMGRPAKLIVVGMVSNGFTIADPTDAGQLDVVGFDTTAPSVIANFVR